MNKERARYLGELLADYSFEAEFDELRHKNRKGIIVSQALRLMSSVRASTMCARATYQEIKEQMPNQRKATEWNHTIRFSGGISNGEASKLRLKCLHT